MHDGANYVNIGEAAEILGTTRRTVYTMIKTGKLEAIQNPIDSREKLISRADIERLARFARQPKKDVA
jgi:excisionase family DNA binding protein